MSVIKVLVLICTHVYEQACVCLSPKSSKPPHVHWGCWFHFAWCCATRWALRSLGFMIQGQQLGCRKHCRARGCGVRKCKGTMRQHHAGRWWDSEHTVLSCCQTWPGGASKQGRCAIKRVSWLCSALNSAYKLLSCKTGLKQSNKVLFCLCNWVKLL